MTGEYLRKVQPGTPYACHCTSLAAKIALAKYCTVQEAGVGMQREW